jgi:hypothetical protein
MCRTHGGQGAAREYVVRACHGGVRAGENGGEECCDGAGSAAGSIRRRSKGGTGVKVGQAVLCTSGEL